MKDIYAIIHNKLECGRGLAECRAVVKSLLRALRDKTNTLDRLERLADYCKSIN